MNNIEGVNWNSYDKISDDIMYLGEGIILKFCVSLTRKSNDNKYYYHNEYEYGPSYNRSYSIKRDFSFYLAIEIKRKDTPYKEVIRITMNDMIPLRIVLDKVYRWFYDVEFKNLYLSVEGDIIINNRPSPIPLILGDNKIAFEPSIMIDYRSGRKIPSVRIYFNSTSVYTDLQVNNFLGFKYFIDSLNMYQSAQELLNYVQRPAFGTNIYTINTDDNYRDQIQEGVSATPNRQIPIIEQNRNKSKSFFDKVDDITK